jgi:glutathione S-transferase
MITVHHLNNSKSQRVLWVLEELELDYEIVFYERQPSFAAPDELKQIHPLGKAPVVEIDGYVMAESGAVVEYLAQKYGDEYFSPRCDSALYPKYLEMLHYPEGSLSPPLLDALFDHMLQIDHHVFTGFIAQRVQSHLSYVSGLLSNSDYLLGDNFSAADLQISFNLQGANARGSLDAFPNLQDFLARMEARPAYLRAIEKGGAFNLGFSRS